MSQVFRKPLCFPVSAILVSSLCNISIAQGAVLEETVVTAQKRDESLTDVPISISVVDEESLSAFEIDDMFDMANFVPGMIFSRAPDDGLALSFRGVASSPRNQAYEQSVGAFLDGVFFGKGRMYSAGLFDLSRVELIMGTQSTLLGKNTSIGAISMVTQKPGDVVSGNVRVMASEHGGSSGNGAIDIPITADLRTRIAGYVSTLQGATRNIYTGHDLPEDDNYAIRATTVWDASDAVAVTLMYQYTQDKKIGDSFQVDVDPNGVALAYGITDSGKLDDITSKHIDAGENGESVHDTDSNIVNFVIDWDVGSHTLTSQTTYVGYDLSYADDTDTEPEELISLIRDETYDQYTQELRITSNQNETLEYMAGVYYFTSTWHSSEVSDWTFPGYPPVVDFPLVPGDLFNGPYRNDFKQDVDNWSVFVSGTWHIADDLRLAAGLRYADEEKNAKIGRTQLLSPVPNPGSLFTPYTAWNTVVNPPFPTTPMDYSKDFVNGNLNVQYDLNEETMLYAAYGRGTKTGGFAESNTIPNADPNTEARIGAETVDNYEIGFKSTLLDGSAQLNAAVFYMDVDGLQETIFTGTEFISANVPAESKGADISGLWQVTDAWRLNAGVVYADAEEKDTGYKLAQAPEWTGNLGFLFEQHLTSKLLFGLQGNLRYQSGQYNQVQESIPETDSLTTLDLTLSLAAADGTWRAEVIGRNITDEVAQNFGYPDPNPALGPYGVVLGSSNALRTYLVQFSYYF